MSETLGIHWSITTYGNWLSGDKRGSWFNGCLIESDPFLEAAARAAMNHSAVTLSEAECDRIADAIGRAAQEWKYRILAATIQPVHLHLVFAPMADDIKQVLARLKYRTARAVLPARRDAGLETPRSLWTRGQFPVFILDQHHLLNAIEYVRDHNRRAGLQADPYDWIKPLYPAGDLTGERCSRSVGETAFID